MASYILEPTLTDEILIRIFERLCTAKVRGHIGYYPDRQDGFESGYVFCLIDFFGQSTEEVNSKAFIEERSYFHIVDEIIETYLINLVGELKQQDISLSAFERIDKEVAKAVRSYMQEKPNRARNAIKSI